MSTPAPNEMFADRYRIDSVLGKGGFATVFKATDVGADRVVAIKVLKQQDGGYSQDIESRFAREVRVIAQLRDPHTVVLHDYGRSDDGQLFMVFEHIPGRDLSEVLVDEERLAPSIVIHILQQVLQALGEAHAKGLLHRDIKPENIRVYNYMGDPYRVKVLDFGIARPAGEVTAITQAGEIVGTPRYMSPEQLVESELRPASDIYSLGLVALEMLAGSQALQGSRWADQLDRLMTGHVFSIHEHERIGPGLRGIIERMTAREPSERYQSVGAVAWALQELTGPSVDQSAPRIATGERPMLAARSTAAGARPTRMFEERPSRNWWPAAVIVSALVVVAILAVVVVQQDREQDEDIRARQRSLALAAARPTPPPASTPQQGTTDDANSTETLDLAEPPAIGSAGCGRSRPMINYGQIERIGGASLPAHLPRDYDPNKAYPLVVLFHQDARSGKEILRQSGFDKLAQKEGIIVLAPQHDDMFFSWDGGMDDVKRVRSLVEDLEQQVCINPDRIFAVGHGSGGIVTELMACEPWIRGVATNGFRSSKLEFTCTTTQPKPSIHLAEMQSPRMLIEGGRGCGVRHDPISLKANRQKWLAFNQCKNKSTEWSKHDDGTCYEYPCAEPFVICEVDGGHGWPGGPPGHAEHDAGGCNDGPVSAFPATDTIWRFFSALPDGERTPIVE